METHHKGVKEVKNSAERLQGSQDARRPHQKSPHWCRRHPTTTDVQGPQLSSQRIAITIHWSSGNPITREAPASPDTNAGQERLAHACFRFILLRCTVPGHDNKGVPSTLGLTHEPPIRVQSTTGHSSYRRLRTHFPPENNRRTELRSPK
jgi:hypothetical protein